MDYIELKAIAKREIKPLCENDGDFEKLELAFMKGYMLSEDIRQERIVTSMQVPEA